MIQSHGNKSGILTFGFHNKVLTVFESGLDSQALEEYFQTYDCQLTPYTFQVKVRFY